MFIAGEPLYIGSEISARLNLLQPPPALPPLYERWGLDRLMSMMMVVLLFYIRGVLWTMVTVVILSYLHREGVEKGANADRKWEQC